MASRPETETACIFVEIGDEATLGERVAAEAWEAGALGVEEREESPGCKLLLLYAAADRVDAITDAVGAVAGATVTGTEWITAVDWSQEWREGLRAIEIGNRLVVRPSWIPVDLRPGQVEVVIDPGQAFGTGAHVSTKLLLDWIEELAGEGAFDARTRIVDVGSGTGVLALCALKLGAGFGVGFDLDPLAGAAAMEWSERNGLADRLATFVGPIDALGGAPFDWLFANLLKREMLPIRESIRDATRVGGHAIFSGLLASDRAEVEAELAGVGFGASRAKTSVDDNGDEWISLLMTRGA